MTQEDKCLLFKDLSARLPYGTMVKYKSQEKEGIVKITCGNIGYVTELGNGWWKECKPYLRPMSSMTRDESYELDHVEERYDNYYDSIVAQIDWLNKHHFDYRRLIKEGLALKAPSEMYKID